MNRFLMLKIMLCSLLPGVLPLTANAYPVVSSITTTSCGSDCAIYNLEWGNIPNLPEAANLPPGGAAYCYAGHKHQSTSGSSPVFAASGSAVPWSATLEECANQVKLPASVTHQGSLGYPECVGVAGYSTLPSPAPPFTGVTLPGGLCIAVPPPDIECYFDGAEISLEHGTVNVGLTRASKITNLHCNAPASLRIKFSEQVLNLGTGVTSTLGSLPGNGDVTVVAGDNPVEFYSDLSVEPSAGADSYSGLSVAYLEFY